MDKLVEKVLAKIAFLLLFAAVFWALRKGQEEDRLPGRWTLPRLYARASLAGLAAAFTLAVFLWIAGASSWIALLCASPLTLLSLLFLLEASTYRLQADDLGLRRSSWRGSAQLFWSDIRACRLGRLETLVLEGRDGQRLSLPHLLVGFEDLLALLESRLDASVPREALAKALALRQKTLEQKAL